MLSGQQKAQILLSLLDDTSNDVLTHLPDRSAKIMTSILDDTPDLSDEELHDLLNETFIKIDEIKKEEALAPPPPIDDDLSSLEVEEEAPEEIAIEPEEPETKPEEPKDTYNENYRHPKKIASILENQNLQLTAFFLRNCEEDFREKIESFISDELKEKISASKVVLIPSSKRIFESMFDEIVLKKEEDEEEEVDEENENSDDLDNAPVDDEIFSL